MYFLKSPSALLVQRHGRLGRWPNGQRVGIDPDRRSPRNMLYISVGAFSIASSIRVLKSKTEKVLETVKNKGRNKGIHSGRPGFNPIFFYRGRSLATASNLFIFKAIWQVLVTHFTTRFLSVKIRLTWLLLCREGFLKLILDYFSKISLFQQLVGIFLHV